MAPDLDEARAPQLVGIRVHPLGPEQQVEANLEAFVATCLCREAATLSADADEALDAVQSERRPNPVGDAEGYGKQEQRDEMSSIPYYFHFELMKLVKLSRV
eukprot:6197657-Pleurochrysis_carterae.AAC.14